MGNKRSILFSEGLLDFFAHVSCDFFEERELEAGEVDVFIFD